MDGYEFYISEIAKSPTKNHWRVLRLKRTVNEHISGLRQTASKLRGTTVAKFCNAEANRYENKLRNALRE
jgi:hypothetical protein